MNRFQIVLLSTVAAAVAACGGEEEARTNSPGSGPMADTATTMEQARGPVTVVAFCDENGPPMGATVQPWKVETKGSETVSWNIVGPGSGGSNNNAKSTEVAPVDETSWPFQETPPIASSGHHITATLLTPNPPTELRYKYKLTIYCPTDTIVIDPIVIVDDSTRPDTVNSNGQ